MSDGLNPYTPPHEVGKNLSPGPSRSRRIWVEMVQAFATILSILIGWILIGAGQLFGSYLLALSGGIVIILACLIGRWRPEKRSRRRDAG